MSEEIDYLIKMENNGEEIVTIQKDGTVIIHKEGGDKKAAVLLYESLQFEGKTLHHQIDDLKSDLEATKERLEILVNAAIHTLEFLEYHNYDTMAEQLNDALKKIKG